MHFILRVFCSCRRLSFHRMSNGTKPFSRSQNCSAGYFLLSGELGNKHAWKQRWAGMFVTLQPTMLLRACSSEALDWHSENVSWEARTMTDIPQHFSHLTHPYGVLPFRGRQGFWICERIKHSTSAFCRDMRKIWGLYSIQFLWNPKRSVWYKTPQFLDVLCWQKGILCLRFPPQWLRVFETHYHTATIKI